MGPEIQNPNVIPQRLRDSYQKAYKQPLNSREISILIGEKGFRELEREVIKNLSLKKTTVIALGGGAILSSENLGRLKKLGRMVYLEIDKETVKKRILQGNIPSFLDENDFDNSFEKMYQKRKPLYEKIDSHRVSVAKKTDRQVLDELISIARS